MTGTHTAAVVSTEGFALHKLSTHLDTATWESEEIACSKPDSMLVWIAGSETETTDTVLDADPSVASQTLVSDGTERRLYRLEWAESAGIMTLLEVLRDQGGMIRSATGTAGEWTLDFLFPNRNGLSDVFETCTASGMQIEITELRELDGDQRARLSLTHPQRKALRVAYDHGYFDIPREINLESLADELGISHQALSERLRRAHQALLNQTIFSAGTTGENQNEHEGTTGSHIPLN